MWSATQASVGERRHPVLGLGPIGVRPDRQGDGIGSTLVREAVAIADARSEGLIGLLGDPAYSRRFGFVRSTDHGVEPPDPAWGERSGPALANHDPSISGRFQYAAAFG